MDVSMDSMENNSVADDNSENQQNQSEGAELSVRPSLSQVKKSWGFRRTTIARREFLDEVGDLAHSPPLVRRGRGRRNNQTLQATPETRANRRATQSARSVIDDLEWSAPSSPVPEESKPASEASAGGSLDPSLWQDFGSAFHTAFSLLGGNEGLSLEMSDALAAPDILKAADAIEAPPPQAMDETEVTDNMESADDMEISQLVAPANVGGGEIEDVVLISSQEEDSDEMTLIQIKEQLASKNRQEDTKTRGGKGGRGKARGRGRGRSRGKGKGKGRGRGRGRAVELQPTIVEDEDSDEVVLVNPVEEQLQQLQDQEKENEPQYSPAEIERSPTHSDNSLSPAQRSNSDCIIIDSDLDQITDVTPGQYDDAPEEEEEEEEEVKKKDDKNVGEYSGISDSKGYDPNALYCICRQKHNKRFMICCDSCQEWFHGSCVGISETQGRKMERRGQEYVCPPCTAKKQSQIQPEPHPQPEPELSFPQCLTLSPSGEEGERHEEPQALKETVVMVEEEEDGQAPVMRPEPEPEADMETDSSLPLCIGPGCTRQALPDSVYCGTDCILQHAAVTMKTLSGPKVPKSKGRPQRKAAAAAAAAARPTQKGQRSARMSKRLAGKAEEESEEEEMQEDDGGQKEAASPLACDPSLTDAQATSLPSSMFYTASKTDSTQVEVDSEDVTPPVDTSADAAPSSQPSADPAAPQSHSPEKQKEPISSGLSKQQSAETNPCIPTNPAKSSPPPAPQSPSTSAPRLHETGALMVTKTTYVIPKKLSAPQPPSSLVSASASCQKPSSAPTLLSETRNLPVPPAPSAPSSRPSQPNNQVRQSIQRSLTSILFKRVCDCEDLEVSESEVAKLVASIEMEMFDIFRNTDSKYMNKYRTIMFNLKDPRNKGLLYRVVRGEISPFRLARMSQKDMQAIKTSEPSAKETTEVKETAAKTTTLLQKPEAVKVDLPSLKPTRPDRSTEQKKSLPAPAPAPVPAPAPAPAPAPKTITSQPSQKSAVPDILTCMLKDTTSEHKTHLFDLKCKICTGQILAGDEEEPAKKKPKVSETRDKYEPSWRKSAGDDSPLCAPPDSPDMDSPTSSLMDPSSRLTIDSPVLTIVESPASPIMDSPASPTLESPASPVLESPASPTPDTPKATTTKRAYTPVVIPAVSTVTITRRDPRTAASRFSALSSATPGPSHASHNQGVPYAPLKETRLAPPSAPASSLQPTKTVPKSILMKPSSSADPRLYGSSSRTMVSESPADGESAQFLAKQDIVWKGFLNMLTVAKFVTKGYLVSGSAENLKADLPDTIQIGGRILPQTVWDYVAKLKTSVTKELCVIRFHPATEEEEVAYVSLFSYFSSRGRFGVVANSSRSIKDIYLVPLSAKESIPSMLQPLEGPGLEKKRPNLLLGLAVVQKVKRPESFPQEVEEKRPQVHMSKDPMWIPKPPVLYGSDKLEIFQPYDPETPANTTPPGSPSCPGSSSESSSSGSVTIPSLMTSVRANPPVSTSATVDATHSTSSSSLSDKNSTAASSDETPLQTILKSLFGSKQTDIASSDESSTTAVSVKKLQVFSRVSGSMVDPIVQQYGQKSKVKEIEEEKNDFDRPYDPEEEYDPAMGYGMVAPQNLEKIKAVGPAVSGFVDDDVAYDPEDETIFADIQSGARANPPIPTQMSNCPSIPTPGSTQAVTPAPTSTPAQTSSQAEVTQNLPTGTVVVSAATLTEQQRMLEELNKQIEEQKRQLKEQEEALRQQREAVGMFMAHFSVSDSLMSPPPKSLPVSQVSSLQSGITQTESRPSESTDKTSNLTENVDCSNVDSQTVKIEDTSAIPNLEKNTVTVTEQDETQESLKESDKYSSAGEIEDSDVAYDPEDEFLFNEIQEEVFQGDSKKTCDSSLSRAGHRSCRKATPQNSHHSRKRRQSPKRRSHRERDRHRSPSRKSQRCSPSHTQRRRERDRHRRSERDRSRHRARDQSERQGRHRKEHTSRRHSHGCRRSPSSPRKKESVSPSPKHTEPSHQLLEKSSTLVAIKNDPDGESNLVESPDKGFSPCSHELLHNVKLEISEPPTSQELQKNSVSDPDDTARGSSTQVDKPSQQETLLKNKIESTVPLREIDPPIRDSPQSPDPEPQFVRPSSKEKSEEIRDHETYTSVSVPPIKVENSCLPIGGQATMSNIPWPTVGGLVSNVRNFDFSDVQGPGVRDQGMIESGKQIIEQSPGLKYPENLSQERGHSNPATCPDIQGSQPDIHPVTKHLGSGISGPGIRNPGPDIKELGHWGAQVPDMRGPRMQGISPSIWFPGPHIHNLALSSQEKYVRDPGSGMPSSETNMNEAHVQHHNTDRIGSGPVMRGSGMRRPVQGMESSTMQGTNPDVKGPGSDVRHIEPEMRGQMLVPAVTNPCMRGPDLQNERRDPVMKGHVLDRPGHDIKGSESREPSSAMYHPSPDTRRLRSVDERRSQDVNCLQAGLLCLKTEEHRSQPENQNGRPSVMETGRDQSFGGPQIEGRAPDIIGRVEGQKDRGESPHIGGMTSAMRGGQARDPGPSFRGSRRVPRHSRHDGSPVLEEKGPQNRGFQPHGREADLSRVGSGRERSLDLNTSTGSEGAVLRADRLSPAITDERRGSQRVRDVPMKVPGPNINFETGGSNMSCIGQDNSEPDIRVERSVHGSDMRESESMHELTRSDMTEQSYRVPVQDMGMGGPDMKGDRSEYHPRSLGRDIRETGPNKRDVDMQGRNIQCLWLERRNEQMGQEDRGPIQTITNPDWGGPGPSHVGPEMRGQSSQNKGQGQHMRDLDWSGRGSDTRDDWRGPDGRGSGPVRGGPFVQDEWRVHQPNRRGPNMEDLRHDRRELGCPDFMPPGPERRGSDMVVPMHDRRLPGGPDFRRPEPERRGPTNDIPGPGMTGSGGPDFVGPHPEMRGLPMEGPGPNRRGLADPDFRRQWPERRDPDMAGPGPDRRGPGGQDVWGPGPERKGPAMDAYDRQEPGGLDFRRPGPERRGPTMEGPGIDRRGPGGPDFRGPGPESRGLSRESPGPDRRGPGGPDFRGAGPERRGPTMEGPGTDRKRPGGPDFRGSGPERRGPTLEAPGPDRRGPGGPNFKGTGPESRGPAMEAPGPDRRGPGGPDFRRAGPERNLSVERSGPDSRGPGCPDFRGPGPDRRGPGVPDFCSPGPERRGSSMGGLGPDSRESGVPDFQGQGPERRGQGGLDLRGPGCESRGPFMHGHGPDRRGPGDQNTGGVGPDRRGPYIRGPGSEFTGMGSEQIGPGMEGPGPGQGAPHFWISGPESGPINMEAPGPEGRGPGIRGPKPERPGSGMNCPEPNRRGPGGSNFRGPGPEKRPPDMEATGNNRCFSEGPQFRVPEPERRPPDMEGQESHSRGPHLRGIRPERTVMEGPGSRKGPRGPDFRGPGCESRSPHIEGPEPDRQQPGGSGFRESGPERRCPDMEGPGTDWRRSGGPNVRGQGIRQRGRNIGLRHRRAGFRGSAPNRRDTDTEEQWSDGIGPSMEAVENERECSGDDWKRDGNRGPGSIWESPDDEWRAPGSRGLKPMQERPNMRFPGPLRGPGDDWGGSQCRGPGPVQDDPDMVFPVPGSRGPGNEWREPDRGNDGPNRWGPGPFFRGERDPDNGEQGQDRRGPRIRGPGSDMRGGSDMGNEWRHPDFRDNMRELNTEQPGAHRGGPDSCPNRRGFEMESLDKRGPRGPEIRRSGPENRNLNIEGPGTDGRFSDFEGLGPERRGIDMESLRTDRKGFDDFRRERRGPEMRRLGPHKTDMRGLAPEISDVRHGPGRWDTISEDPGLDCRGSEPASPHFNSPHHVARFQGPGDPHSALYSGPLGPAQNSGGNLCPSQNQQAVKPQRHKAALLPTPTEGLIRFPNRMINKPDVFSLKRKQTGHPTNREWNRGRPVSREREFVKGHRREQEKGPAGKISTPVAAATKEKGNETDKQGIRGAAVETKTKHRMDSDGNRGNVKPS